MVRCLIFHLAVVRITAAAASGQYGEILPQPLWLEQSYPSLIAVKTRVIRVCLTLLSSPEAQYVSGV